MLGLQEICAVSCKHPIMNWQLVSYFRWKRRLDTHLANLFQGSYKDRQNVPLSYKQSLSAFIFSEDLAVPKHFTGKMSPASVLAEQHYFQPLLTISLTFHSQQLVGEHHAIISLTSWYFFCTSLAASTSNKPSPEGSFRFHREYKAGSQYSALLPHSEVVTRHSK